MMHKKLFREELAVRVRWRLVERKMDVFYSLYSHVAKSFQKLSAYFLFKWKVLIETIKMKTVASEEARCSSPATATSKWARM